jgi:hypothetical protein
MKKILLLCAFAGFVKSANAQVPKKVSTSLVHKITATWCGPCGSWGWTLSNDLIAATSSKALYMNLYASSGTTWNNSKFYTLTSYDLAQAFTLIGYPDFGNNGISHTAPNYDGSSINTTKVKSDIIAAVDAFALTTPVASSANSIKITGSSLTVDARVKFWSAASGDYYLAAYLIEDGAMNSQNGQTTTTGSTSHHDVMRGSLSTSAWGELVATGSIAANATFTKPFSFTISDATWDKTKLKVYTVLWKKVGAKYQYVNASETEVATSIDAIAGVNSVKLSPNPSMGQNTNVSIQSTENKDLNISVVNVLGQTVYNTTHNVVVGMNNLTIPSSNFADGMYQVMISAENGTIVEKLSIVK